MAEEAKKAPTKKKTTAVETAETTTPVVVEKVAKKATAKAGKRSEKALKEAEQKVAKETRKTEAKTEEKAAVRPATTPARSRLERRGKKYRDVVAQIDRTKVYPLNQAVELATKTSVGSFDATVELHLNLGVDPKQADQNIRQTVVLPEGTGKTVRVAVFADADDAAKAKKAGADIAAGDEFLQQLDKGTIDFDVLIATPAMMPKLGKYARVLGPKGLMPNPKSGTVTPNVAKAVTEAKAGRVEYRVDSTGIIHVGIGKISFGGAKLVTNAQAILDSVRAAKPASVKGVYLKSGYLTTTMGPSIKFEIS